MTFLNQLVITCFGGCKPEILVTNFVGKVIFSLCKLVLIEIVVVYDFF